MKLFRTLWALFLRPRSVFNDEEKQYMPGHQFMFAVLGSVWLIVVLITPESAVEYSEVLPRRFNEWNETFSQFDENVFVIRSVIFGGFPGFVLLNLFFFQKNLKASIIKNWNILTYGLTVMSFLELMVTTATQFSRKPFQIPFVLYMLLLILLSIYFVCSAYSWSLKNILLLIPYMVISYLAVYFVGLPAYLNLYNHQFHSEKLLALDYPIENHTESAVPLPSRQSNFRHVGDLANGSALLLSWEWNIKKYQGFSFDGETLEQILKGDFNETTNGFLYTSGGSDFILCELLGAGKLEITHHQNLVQKQKNELTLRYHRLNALLLFEQALFIFGSVMEEEITPSIWKINLEQLTLDKQFRFNSGRFAGYEFFNPFAKNDSTLLVNSYYDIKELTESQLLFELKYIHDSIQVNSTIPLFSKSNRPILPSGDCTYLPADSLLVFTYSEANDTAFNLRYQLRDMATLKVEGEGTIGVIADADFTIQSVNWHDNQLVVLGRMTAILREDWFGNTFHGIRINIDPFEKAHKITRLKTNYLYNDVRYFDYFVLNNRPYAMIHRGNFTNINVDNSVLGLNSNYLVQRE